jgi:S-methyl-5-thioribose-1-phosphate isomerase
MNIGGKHYRTVWMEGPVVRMIDQPLLPHRFEIVSLADCHATAEAIRTMVVRGAPAIGATGGYGMAQAALAASPAAWREEAEAAARELAATRPTAQDLFFAIRKVKAAIDAAPNLEAARAAAVATAQEIADASARACEEIGRAGARLIRDGAKILTHCNAGWLACVDWGTALSPIYMAMREGKRVFVFADETRPRCQGANLTAYELGAEGVPHAVIADNAAGYFMYSGQVDLVIVGADRVARNGDVANKIGTYEKAVLAHRHGIPFYVAAPTQTIDFDCSTGAGIPIEERDEEEVLTVSGRDADGTLRRVRIAPAQSRGRNPAFDVTPAELVTALITEKGVLRPQELAAGEAVLRAR